MLLESLKKAKNVLFIVSIFRGEYRLKLFFKMCGGRIFKTIGSVSVSSKSVREFCQGAKIRFSDVYFLRILSFFSLAYNGLRVCAYLLGCAYTLLAFRWFTSRIAMLCHQIPLTYGLLHSCICHLLMDLMELNLLVRFS